MWCRSQCVPTARRTMLRCKGRTRWSFSCWRIRATSIGLRSGCAIVGLGLVVSSTRPGRASLNLTPLYYAMANGQWHSTVPWLLKKGATYNMSSSYTYRRPRCKVTGTLLAECCRLGRYQDAIRLVDLGIDITLPLHVDNENGARAKCPSCISAV